MTREEAIKELIEFKDKSWDGMPEEVIDIAIQALEQERECGKWIPIPYELDYHTDAECSLCHEQFIDAIRYNYCPYCGAKMERGDK